MFLMILVVSPAFGSTQFERPLSPEEQAIESAASSGEATSRRNELEAALREGLLNSDTTTQAFVFEYIQF